VPDLKGKLSQAVHLCLDMQRLFDVEGPWPTPWMPRVLPKVVELARRSPERAIFTRFVPPFVSENPPGMWSAYYRKWSHVRRGEIDEGLLELPPALARFAPPAKIYDKRVYSAFADGRLHGFLSGHGVDTVILTGSETDVCVLSTALAAVDLGYRVVVARDAVCSSSDEAHDAMIRLYQSRYDVQIALADVEEIIEAWAPHLA
jgi:nicotinamidase-related amidase